MTVTFIVRMRFAPEDRALITDLLTHLAEASRQEPGCLAYVPCTAAGDPDQVLIWEQYQDEAALQAHRSSPHFQRWAAGGLSQHMLERSVEDLTAVF